MDFAQHFYEMEAALQAHKDPCYSCTMTLLLGSTAMNSLSIFLLFTLL